MMKSLFYFFIFRVLFHFENSFIYFANIINMKQTFKILE